MKNPYRPWWLWLLREFIHDLRDVARQLLRTGRPI